MATAGPNLPSAAISLANAGTNENANPWLNPTNIYGAGSASITAATFDAPDISEILVASGFGFTLNANDTITGITVVINKRGYTSANSGMDNRVQLATGTTFATLVGANKATGSVWPQTTLADTTYGGTSDTWTASLTPTQVNDAGFSVFLSAYANVANADIDVNSITVTLTYTPGPVTQTGTFIGSAIEKRTQTATLFADAIEKANKSGNVPLAAYLLRVAQASAIANAIVKRPMTGSALVDAIAKRGQSGSLTGESILLRSGSAGVWADAELKGLLQTLTGSMWADAVTGLVGRCLWTAPLPDDQIGNMPELRFLMPLAKGPMSFWLELDTAATFDSPNLRQYRTTSDQTNWTYWDGGTWQAVPGAGVPATYAGYEAKFIVPTPLPAGIWYRRVRAGVH